MSSNTKPPKPLYPSTQKLLKELGITQEDIARELHPDLMIPKMAMIGIFESIQKFCDVGKSYVIGNAGPLNVQTISTYLQAMLGIILSGKEILTRYELASAKFALLSKPSANDTDLTDDELDELDRFLEETSPTSVESSSPNTDPNVFGPSTKPSKKTIIN